VSAVVVDAAAAADWADDSELVSSFSPYTQVVRVGTMAVVAAAVHGEAAFLALAAQAEGLEHTDDRVSKNWAAVATWADSSELDRGSSVVAVVDGNDCCCS
jgi:hypothetical protein